MDLRDEKQKWPDLDEFDIPEAVGITASEDFLELIRDKLISMVNYLSQVNQFIPDVKAETENLVVRIKRGQNRRNKVIQYYLATSEDIPQSHRKSTDLMIAFVEGDIAVSRLKKIDDDIVLLENELFEKKEKLYELEYRREVLLNGIESCQHIIDSILWELKRG